MESNGRSNGVGYLAGLAVLLALAGDIRAQTDRPHEHDEGPTTDAVHRAHADKPMSDAMTERNRAYDRAWAAWRDDLFGVDIRPGQVVADIGAGAGELSLRLAQRVGERGRVYATEIDAGKLKDLAVKASGCDGHNLVPVLGTEHDPLLPPGQVNIAFMVEVYHHVADKTGFLANLRRRLPPDASLVIVEPDLAQPGGNPDGCYSDIKETRRLVREAGFDALELRTNTIDGCRFFVLTARVPG